MSHSYPSDISREQFVRILPVLESARRRTKPRTVDLYDVFRRAVPLENQWRMLPADFSNWRTCQVFPAMVRPERPGPGEGFPGASPKKNRLARPDKAMDGKSRPASASWTPERQEPDTAGHKGYDAGKKVSGSSVTSRWTRKDCPMRYTCYRRRYRGRGFGDV